MSCGHFIYFLIQSRCQYYLLLAYIFNIYFVFYLRLLFLQNDLRKYIKLGFIIPFNHNFLKYCTWNWSLNCLHLLYLFPCIAYALCLVNNICSLPCYVVIQCLYFCYCSIGVYSIFIVFVQMFHWYFTVQGFLASTQYFHCFRCYCRNKHLLV